MEKLEKYVVYYNTSKQISILSKKMGKYNNWGEFESSLGVHHNDCVFDSIEDAKKYLKNANYIVEAV